MVTPQTRRWLLDVSFQETNPSVLLYLAVPMVILQTQIWAVDVLCPRLTRFHRHYLAALMATPLIRNSGWVVLFWGPSRKPLHSQAALMATHQILHWESGAL